MVPSADLREETQKYHEIYSTILQLYMATTTGLTICKSYGLDCPNYLSPWK
jgi:hypothetical protein